jgi:glycosyltransferase involved in cell wall biosynthesis
MSGSMKNLPRISVLMPVHQAEGTLAKALGGILGGTLTDLELVAVDDGSTDGSPAILAEAARRDSRLRVITIAHRGITPALVTALDAARAPLVARMDADDISDPQRLARQAAALEAHPHWAGAGCCIGWLAASGPTPGMERYAAWQNGLLEPADIRRAMFIENPVTHATLLLRRPALDRAGGYLAQDWSEDYDLVLRLLLGGQELGKVPEVLYHWRESSGRLTRTGEHCSAESFHRTRVHYLRRYVLAGQRRVALWGVGELGVHWKRSLESAGLQVAYHPINPRAMKISLAGRVHIAPQRLPASGPLVLIACGTQGNRDLLRAAATAAGLVEGDSLWCVG